MPRKKIQPKPIEIISCDNFDIEIMEDGWNLKGRGSNKTREFRSNVDAITLKMIDDFLDHNQNLKPVLSKKNDYLNSASAFARKVEQLGLVHHLESDQQLRKYYYRVVKKEIETNIRIKVGANPPPESFQLKKLLDYFKFTK